MVTIYVKINKKTKKMSVHLTKGRQENFLISKLGERGEYNCLIDSFYALKAI